MKISESSLIMLGFALGVLVCGLIVINTPKDNVTKLSDCVSISQGATLQIGEIK